MRLLRVWLTDQGARVSLVMLRWWVGLDWIPFSMVERWSRVRCDILGGGCVAKALWTCD